MNRQCPSWCERPHRYAGPTLIHEGAPETWGVAEGCGQVTRRWRSYDEGPPLLAMRVDTDTVTAELELTVDDVRQSMRQLVVALRGSDPAHLAS